MGHGLGDADSWERQLLLAIGKVEGRMGTLESEVRATREENSLQTKKIDRLEEQFHGRVRKVEHTVFGNEEINKIGLAEKVRLLESGWAKLTTISVVVLMILIEAFKTGGSIMLSTIGEWLSKPHIHL